MKNRFTICCLLLVLSIGTSCINSNSDSEVKLVTAQEMQSILDLEDAQIIDVRTAKEHHEVRIANSQNIDFTSPTFEQDISKLDKKKPVIVYCKSGGRSAKCSKKMIDAGFEKVYDLEGGISKWKHSDKLEIEIKS
ncbi:MAG: rhodanese-like domain-containing protein [Winogradskyella sp.]|uniref:rhodanese-like domain-containing protein n=1 Tax=Winogradskyella sp. TaxID=1883156 RepID=UPI00385C316A